MRLGLADRLLSRPVAQAEWREVLAWLRGDDVPLPAVAGAGASMPAAAQLTGLRVLVVDDSPALSWPP